MPITYTDNDHNVRKLNYVFNYNKKELVSSRICTEGMYIDTTIYIYDDERTLRSQNKFLYSSTSGFNNCS